MEMATMTHLEWGRAKFWEISFWTSRPRERPWISRHNVALTLENDYCVLPQIGPVRVSQFSLWLEYFQLPILLSRRAQIWLIMTSCRKQEVPLNKALSCLESSQSHQMSSYKSFQVTSGCRPHLPPSSQYLVSYGNEQDFRNTFNLSSTYHSKACYLRLSRETCKQISEIWILIPFQMDSVMGGKGAQMWCLLAHFFRHTGVNALFSSP